MFQYRQVIHRMRMGQSDRAIAKARLMGRVKCRQLRAVAVEHGWLGNGPLPDDSRIDELFGVPNSENPTRQSLGLDHQDRVAKWMAEGVWLTTIYRTLVGQFGFTGESG